MHTNNRFFDDLARVVTGAAGAAQGVRSDMETALRLRAERIAQELDLASREDLEALRTLLARSLAETEALRERVEALEAKLAARSRAKSGQKSGPKSASGAAAGKRPRGRPAD